MQLLELVITTFFTVLCFTQGLPTPTTNLGHIKDEGGQHSHHHLTEELPSPAKLEGEAIITTTSTATSESVSAVSGGSQAVSTTSAGTDEDEEGKEVTLAEAAAEDEAVKQQGKKISELNLQIRN